MISAWWLIAPFFIGVGFGVMLIALVSANRDND